MVNASPQAVIKIIRNGGTRSPAQIRSQWRYISQDNEVELELPDDAQGAVLPPDEWTPASRDWAVGTGRYTMGQPEPANKDMTTHIIVSFPPGTDPQSARNAARAWAETMFREAPDAPDDTDDDDGMDGNHRAAAAPYDLPQKYNYIAAFHTDRDHPHMHIVVNRRGDEGGWLKISKRHPVMNYDNMREKLVEAAAGEGIELEATTRAERGLEGRPMNDAQYRRQERERLIEINPANNTNRPLNSDSESDGDFDYDDDSEVHYSIASGTGRAGAAGMDIPDEIHVDGGGLPDDDTSLDGGVARARAPGDDGYDGDSDSDSESGRRRKRQRFARQDSSSDEDSSDDGGGKPAALTGAALGAMLEGRRQAEAAEGTGGAVAESDQSDDAAPARKRGRADPPERTMTLRSDTARQEQDQPADGVEPGDQSGPARRRQRIEVPERTMELRSDIERQRQADEAEGLHLRSGRIITKRKREENRTDDRDTGPRNR